jgi:hypothetical protein
MSAAISAATALLASPAWRYTRQGIFSLLNI